jgi:hypothetical protein
MSLLKSQTFMELDLNWKLNVVPPSGLIIVVNNYRTYSVYDQVTKKTTHKVLGGSDCGACSPLADDIDKFVEV